MFVLFIQKLKFGMYLWDYFLEGRVLAPPRGKLISCWLYLHIHRTCKCGINHQTLHEENKASKQGKGSNNCFKDIENIRINQPCADDRMPVSSVVATVLENTSKTGKVPVEKNNSYKAINYVFTHLLSSLH